MDSSAFIGPYGIRNSCFNLFIACGSLNREALPENADIAV